MAYQHLLLAACTLLLTAGCSNDDEAEIAPPAPSPSGPSRLYVLCEGNMGSNDCRLDYLDLRSGEYHKSAFRAANPGVSLGLGDVGNDLQINGGQLWIAVTNSNRVVVCDASTLLLRGLVEVAQPRCIAFYGGHAYVTSYGNHSGTVGTEPGEDVGGTVVEVDTLSLRATRRCAVGCRPEGIGIVAGRAYVANSLTDPKTFAYDKTVSVVELDVLQETKRVEVLSNPGPVRASGGRVYVACRGNYADEQAQLVSLETVGNSLAQSWPVTAGNLWPSDGALLYVGTDYGPDWKPTSVVGALDIATGTPLPNPLSDAELSNITYSYSIAKNPETGALYVGDALDFVSPGRLHVYTSAGMADGSAETGVAPGHLAFY